MTDKEIHIQELEGQFPAMSGIAFTGAFRKTLDSGQSVLQSDQGVIYELFPDGTRRPVKKIEPPTPVTPGRKITIR